jgi:hypothetical protein
MTNLSDSKSITRHCAHCGNSAELRCSRCNDSYFCDSECQKAAWPKHRKIYAKDDVEKAVRRAGWLLQELYYSSTEHAMTEHIHEVHWEAERLVITYNQSFGHFFKLMPHLKKPDKDRRIILSADQCKRVVASFGELLNILLKGKSQLYGSSTSMANMLTMQMFLSRSKRLTSNYGHQRSGCVGSSVATQTIAANLPQITSSRCSQQRISADGHVSITNAQYDIHQPFSEANQYMK